MRLFHSVEHVSGEMIYFFMGRKTTLIHLFLIVITGIIIYSNTLDSPFVWDDKWLILNNPKIRDLSNFTDITGTRYLTYLSFAVNYKLDGYDVTGYHILNIAVHIINAMLVYFLVALIFRIRNAKCGIRNTGLIALFAGVLFVSHPVHTMAVTYTTQRSSLLATMFYLLSLVMYIVWRLKAEQQSRRAEEQNSDSPAGRKGSSLSKIMSLRYGSSALVFYCSSLISAVLAMKCKEIAFTLPIVILIFDRYFFGQEWRLKKSIIYTIPILLTLLIIPFDTPQPDVFNPAESGTFRIKEGGVLSGLDAKLLSEIPRKNYMLTGLRVIPTYARLFFFPINLNIDYDYPIYSSFSETNVFLPFLFILCFLTAALYIYHRLKSQISGSHLSAIGYRLFSFGILWFLITLSIESFVAVLNFVIFEYRFYLPSIGIILILTGTTNYITARLKNKLPYMYAIVIIIVIVFSISAYVRNRVFKGETILWQDVVKKAPSRADAHHNLGLAYYKIGRRDEGMQELLTSVNLNPGSVEVQINLGNAYMDLGLFDKAIAHYKLALMINPNHAGTHSNLGLAYIQKGLKDEALIEIQTALKINPDLTQAREALKAFYK